MLMLLDAEMQVLLGYDVDNHERAKVLFEDNAREWWVEVSRLALLALLAPDLACAPAGDVEGDTRAAGEA